MAETLTRQNRGWGAGAKTLNNIERLKNGASVIVTGQQVGLFGGPMYAVLKALTAIKHTEASRQAGVDCVPVFWLATEDHDLDEVKSVNLLSADGSLRKLSIEPDAQADALVGDVALSGVSAQVTAAAETFADGEMAALLRECYQPKATFGDAFACLFAKLFVDFGLILLDPRDEAFHDIAKPLFVSAAKQSAQLKTALLARGKELESAGYDAQVKVMQSSTVLFAMQYGARTAVHRANGNFTIGKEKLSESELIALIEARPQEFTGNALFRPVIEDYLLPTLAYVGGPAEVAYFAQSEVLYKTLLGRVTPILPRASVTLVDAKAQRLLKKYGMSVPQAFVPRDAVRRAAAAKSLPAELDGSFESTRSELEKSLTALSSQLRALDPTLEDAAKRATAKMSYQLKRLKGRAGAAELRKNADIERHAAHISDSLFPYGGLQERGVAGISFVGRHGIGWLRELCDALDLKCAGHQVLYL